MYKIMFEIKFMNGMTIHVAAQGFADVCAYAERYAHDNTTEVKTIHKSHVVWVML